MSRRLYLGRLPPDTRSEDITKLFDGYGKVIDCRVMTGFGFVEFENARDAEDAVNSFNGKQFNGQAIVVEFAKESRPRREPYESDRNSTPRRRPGIRIIVSGISRDTSWQDLKDFGREAGGQVTYSDIDRDVPGQGVLEYVSQEDADRAVKELDGRDLRGRPVRVAIDESRGGVDNYRRDDRRDDRDRHRDDRRYDDRRHDDRDRHRDDRERGYGRRDRSRSPAPPRRDDRDRRPRSPPPRRDYEDRRPTGYDDRRSGFSDRRDPDYYDRRSERPREDDRRPPRDEERKERIEDRPPRSANGDASWSR